MTDRSPSDRPGGGAGHVATDPWSSDPRLVGRTYAIPFGVVWDTCVRLAAGGLIGWRMVGWDDQEGVIDAAVQGRLISRPANARIRVGLDDYGQTRVDLTVELVGSTLGLGTNERRIHRFLRLLDEGLEAAPEQILDPRGTPYAA